MIPLFFNTVVSHGLTPEPAISDCVPKETINLSHIACRISDRGGGIRNDLVKKIWDYGFTTSGETDDSRVSGGLFGQVMENRNVGSMHG